MFDYAKNKYHFCHINVRLYLRKWLVNIR